MKIGVIVDNDLNSDIRVLREIKLLQKVGYEVVALCFSFNKKNYSPIENLKVVRIDIEKSKKNKLYFLYHLLPGYKNLWSSNIAKFIDGEDLDALHVHDLYMALSAKKGIEKSKKDIPFSLDLHENYPTAIKSYNWTKGLIRSRLVMAEKWEKLEGPYLKMANHIIVLSEDFKLDLSKKHNLKKEKFFIIPNVPELNLMSREAKSSIPQNILNFKNSDDVLFFYFGVIGQRRGIFETLEAFQNVVKKNDNCKLLLIGPIDNADKEAFHELSKGLVEKGKMLYEPWINLKDLPVYLDFVDVGLAPFLKNPQHESGIANKIFQYMYGEIPVLASNCKPQQDLLEKEKAGLIFSSSKEQEQMILKLAEDQNLRNELGKNGFTAVKEKYNIDLYQNEMKKAFSFNP